ncbi:hypothetical protein ACO0LD_31705 [Undibacterium sp. Ji83W]|uniref:hypothetical protein n=1 Tax=Undibacterium sp. Ji83W TaxID=3413043 RepID=UPI003BF33B21
MNQPKNLTTVLFETKTRHQLLLGDEAFVEKYQHQLRQEELREVSLAHRRSVTLPLQAYQQKYADFRSVELLGC